MLEKTATFVRDLKFAARSLAHAKGLMATVIITLALGIGGNAAMFSLVRGVLLLPLVNRDESRLIYIQQTANARNAWFSVPEIDDLRARIKTLRSFGDFSTIEFTMLGLGEPRTVQAGVVGGSYFQVMGLRRCWAGCWTRAMTAPTPPARWSSHTASGRPLYTATLRCSARPCGSARSSTQERPRSWGRGRSASCPAF